MASFGRYFSSTFGVDKSWLETKGVFDPTLDVDAPLFIDPFLLPHSKHAEFSTCGWEKYEQHIGTIYHLVRESMNGHRKAWEAAHRKFCLGEVDGLQGTCLGYSKRSVRGRGIGPKLAAQSLGWAEEVIKLGVKDPEFFSAISLFEKGIGADMISDFVANIILECIISFNDRIYKEIRDDLGVDIKLQKMQVGKFQPLLPQNPFDNQICPVILLSDDVLKFLPIMDDPRNLAKFAGSNDDVRQRVNDQFGEIFKIRYQNEKDEIKKRAMESAEKFQALLDVLKIAEKIPYDIKSDPEGLLAWSHIAETTTSIHKVLIKDDKDKPEIDRINDVVNAMIGQFTELVENNRLYQVFYVDHKPRHERFAQLLFFSICKSYCDANNLDISPESDGGAGPVDFKLSRGKERVVVEIKLSTNSKVVNGYATQLEAYAKAESAAIAHYVVIDVGSIGNKWKKLSDLHSSQKGSSKGRHIHLVDGTPKVSASKLVKE